MAPPNARMLAQNAAWGLLIAGALQALGIVTRLCFGMADQALLEPVIGFIVFTPLPYRRWATPPGH
ncbi:hypothetical protein BQ8482_110942 [Mesorhizobium delmotii]|uniref:Uncharacterized protein n=1 Tax=Mesorhizobium delmotii TaxID=1631247 RepID=A0A2P9AD54_9HYPH|nr:hypothetical protein BQ8482_110942 [Mesorhizobium delmotii]